MPVKSLLTHAHNTKSRIFALSNFVSLSMKYHVTAVTPNLSFENTVQNVYHISMSDVYVTSTYVEHIVTSDCVFIRQDADFLRGSNVKVLMYKFYEEFVTSLWAFFYTGLCNPSSWDGGI